MPYNNGQVNINKTINVSDFNKKSYNNAERNNENFKPKRNNNNNLSKYNSNKNLNNNSNRNFQDISNAQITKNEPIKSVSLYESEIPIYGDRFPHNLQKLEFLGRGGCAIVWLGKEGSEKIAIKQFSKINNFKNKSDIESAKREKIVCEYINNNIRSQKVTLKLFPGLRHISLMTYN